MKQNKRAKQYERPIQLKDGVAFSDLIGLSLQKPKEEAPKVKKTKAKKK